jgi:penicillin-binding protein 1C
VRGPRKGSNRLKRIATAFSAVAATLFGWGWFDAALFAPQPTPILLDRNGGFMAQIAAPDDAGYGYWEIADLPPRVVAATVALEDRRFWWHPGVDPLAIGRAVWQNVTSGNRVSGASTLAMQVVRMQDPAARNYLNKAREASTALFLTLRYGREAVLRQYLKLAPYGNGSHGIAHAARFYFDKPVADLSWAEIAFLAAIPQAPSRMNPLLLDGRADAITRGHRILDALQAGNVITETEHALAASQLDDLPLLDRRTRPENALHAILNLQRMIEAADVKPTDPRIVTTFAREIQGDVETLTRQYLDRWRKDGAEQAAAVVVDVTNGEVLAWVGSSGYFQTGTGAIDFALTERSPGSALKPFIYALALDRGAIAPETQLLDTAFSAGTIANSDRAFLGVMTPRRALANSRNVPAANLTKAIGLDETFLYLRLLGVNQAERPASYYGLSLSVGALPTTLEKLTRAYLALADDGVMRDLIWLRNAKPQSGTRVMSVDAARLVTQFLSDPSARLPSFPRMGSTEYPFPVALKTGTSQGYRDAWTMAFSRKYLVGVWVGRSDAGPMRDVTGAGSAAELARAILLDLHGDVPDVAALSFPAPPNYRLGSEKLPEWTNGQEAVKPAAVDPDALAGLTLPDHAAGSVTVVSPRNNMRVIRNPELPADLASLPLKATVPAGTTQVVWYVDGKPFLVGAADTVARWPLQPGAHTFEAKLPYLGLTSAPATIQVE